MLPDMAPPPPSPRHPCSTQGATDAVRHSERGSGGDPIRAIAAKRFEELDKFGTGRVSFLEFLFCLEGWVEDAEEEQ